MHICLYALYIQAHTWTYALIQVNLYVHVCACMSQYLGSHMSSIKCICACMVCAYMHMPAHMHCLKAIHMCMYVLVCLAWIHTHMQMNILRWLQPYCCAFALLSLCVCCAVAAGTPHSRSASELLRGRCTLAARVAHAQAQADRQFYSDQLSSTG